MFRGEVQRPVMQVHPFWKSCSKVFYEILFTLTLLRTAVAWFLPHPHPARIIIMGGLNLKIFQNLRGQNFFLNLWGDKLLWGELELNGVSNLSLFHFFRNSQHPENWTSSFKKFFTKCEWIRTCYLPILKFTTKVLKKNFTFCAFFCCIFQTINVIVVIRILEKYL